MTETITTKGSDNASPTAHPEAPSFDNPVTLDNNIYLGESLIISIKEARKLLGKRFDDLTDEEIENIIETLSRIARDTIRK